MARFIRDASVVLTSWAIWYVYAFSYLQSLFG